ncbi:MAG: 50S ribosomal protein L25 [Clostridiales bacterium]|nr:50S ribosomal protein L25 [Clostridiales bacterium]
MATAELKIQIRKDVSKAQNKKLKKDGYLIGVINQKGMDSVPIAVKMDEFRRALKQNGRNAIFKLQDNDKNSYDVMVKTIDITPLKYEYNHVDFQKVALDEEIKMDVALRFVGVEFLQAKRLILNTQMDTILVSGLPQNIPDSIEVDVQAKEDGDSIFVSDLVLGEGISTDVDPTQPVATISEVKVVVEETEEEDSLEVGSVVEESPEE